MYITYVGLDSMKTCLQCKEKENDNDERFCMSCGADMYGADVQTTSKNSTKSITTLLNEPTQITHNKSPARLILDDKTLTIVDNSHRLIGRADLKSYTNKDPSLISRSHFTVYRQELRYLIKDGVTAVQDKPSKEGTLLNGEPLDTETELKNGDKITVSDIEIIFER